MNALAGKYNIPVLKEFKFKIGKSACDFFHSREIINAIFENTPDSDLGLRNTVVSRCANARNLEKCLNEEGLATVIRKHGNFGLGMLQEVVMKHNSELEKQKQGVKTRAIELRLAVGSLLDDATHLHIPGKEDSQKDFERAYEALERLEQKLWECLDVLI